MPISSNDSLAPSRRRLLLVVAVFALPLLAAAGWYLLAPQTVPRGGMHGSLIEPAQALDPFEAEGVEGGVYALDDLRGHWTMVHPVGGRCGERCRERLYATRQIHDALAEDRIRVRRLALADVGRETPGLAEILGEHPRLTILREGRRGGLGRQLPRSAPGTVLLIDPHGNLMMRFGPETSPRGILDDLEHLLKVSRIG